jgi:hypothetical protein
MTTRAERHWSAWLFAPTDPLPLGLFRIALGVVLLARFLTLCLTFDPLFTEASPVTMGAAREYGRLVTTALPYYRLNLFALSESNTWAAGLFAVYGAAIVAFLIGRHTRVAALLVLVLTHSVHHREPILWVGGDSVLQVYTFWMLFVPAGAALSLDAARRMRNNQTRPIVRRWSLLLLQAQLALIYLSSFLLKLDLPAWTDGTALGLAWQMPLYGRPWGAALAAVPGLVLLGTWTTMIFEIAFPFLVWLPRFRPWLLVVGAVFHIGIELTLRTGPFSWAMLACYVPFVPAEYLRNWFERAAERKPEGLLWQWRALSQGRWVVYYNGACSFCRRWARRGEKMTLPFVHWRDFQVHREEVAHLNPRFDQAAYLIMDGRVALPGFLGFRRLLLAMPALWPLLPVVYLPGSRRIGDALYRYISVRYGPVRAETPSCGHKHSPPPAAHQ